MITLADELLDKHDMFRLWKFKAQTLAAWRLRGQGPKFVRISSRCVRYRRSDVEDWMKSLEVSPVASTADGE